LVRMMPGIFRLGYTTPSQSLYDQPATPILKAPAMCFQNTRSCLCGIVSPAEQCSERGEVVL
jgi:hypothetical protein